MLIRKTQPTMALHLLFQILVSLLLTATHLFGQVDSLLRILPSLQDSSKVVMLVNISNEYLSNGEHDNALKYILMAVDLSERLDIGKLQFQSYGTLSIVYLNQNNPEKSLEFAQKSMYVCKNKYPEGLHRAVLRVGSAFKTINSDSALVYLFEANRLSKIVNDSAKISASLQEIGMTYINKKDYSKAIEYYQKSLTLDKILESDDVKYSLNNIADAHNHLGQYAQAEPLIRQAMALNTSDKNDSLTFVSTLAETLEGLGKSRDALASYKQAYALERSMFNEEKAKEILSIQQKFDVEQAERIRQEAEKNARENENRRNLAQYSVMFLIVLVMVFGVIFLGKLQISDRWINVLLIVSLIMVFEFVQVVLDPLIQEKSQNIPIYLFIISVVMAVALAPLHSLFETFLRKRIMRDAPPPTL